jgi:hypothetical protein
MENKFTNIVATSDGGEYRQASIGASAQSTNVLDKYASTLIPTESQVTYGTTQRFYESASTLVSDADQAASNAVIVSLSAGWLGISFGKLGKSREDSIEAQRYNRQNLFSLQLGEFFMPLSQTFNLRAKKRLNTCSLVDGIDIIQQTRHEAKTIDCSLRITLRENQPNLEIVTETQRLTQDPYKAAKIYEKGQGRKYERLPSELIRSLDTFSHFLTELYENDAVFAIENQVINDVFGVDYAIISEYNFRPQVGRGTFQFDFTLTEVKISDDTLTFDVREIGGSNG